MVSSFCCSISRSLAAETDVKEVCSDRDEILTISWRKLDMP